VQNLSYENEFDLHESEPVGGRHFQMNGFARTLVLSQRQKAPRKWPVIIYTKLNPGNGVLDPYVQKAHADFYLLNRDIG